jgi:hypothetical protein
MVLSFDKLAELPTLIPNLARHSITISRPTTPGPRQHLQLSQRLDPAQLQQVEVAGNGSIRARHRPGSQQVLYIERA